MNNYNLILSGVLLITFLMSIFGIYFLIILEISRCDGLFQGIKGVFLSLLFPTSIITGSILIFRTGCYPEDVTPKPHMILDYSLWPELMIWLVMNILIFLVVVAVKFAGEKDKANLPINSTQEPKNEKLHERK